MAAFSEGRWAEACDFYDRSETVFREHGVGAAFEINLARLYSLLALYYRGQFDDLNRRAALLYQEARERGDFLATMYAGLVKLYGPALRRRSRGRSPRPGAKSASTVPNKAWSCCGTTFASGR